MKSMLVLIAVACLVATAAAEPPLQSQKAPQKPRAQVYVLEGLGALPGVAGCGCLAMGFGTVAVMAAWGGGSKGTIAGAVSLEVASLVLLPAAAAMGTISVGERLGEHGSKGWAVVGAYAGLPLAAGAIALGVRIMNDPHGPDLPGLAIPLYVLGGLAIPTGAVLGYNLGATSRSDFGSRLQPPGVMLTSVELPDHSVEYGVKVQLAGLRF